MVRTAALAWVLMTMVGCGGQGDDDRGKRTPARDDLCTNPAQPHAYAPANPTKAENAGCVEVRVHMSKQDPSTGEPQHYEDLVYCCP